MPPDRDFLRRAIATIAYRSRRPLADAPADFSDFRASETSRTAGRILAHMADLFDWALSLVDGNQKWRDSQPLPWDEAAARFYDSLAAFDAFLASDKPFACPAEKLFQGPIADCLTHVGQLALLRRLADSPVMGENYFVAEVSIGRVGPEQAAPHREFDSW